MNTETVVKLSHPIKKYGYDNLGARQQSPGNLGRWGNYRFEINNDVDECDFWVVFESVPHHSAVSVPPGNTIAVLSEPAHYREYTPDYLRQFDWIFTWREDIAMGNVLRSWCLDGWWLARTYDQLKSERIEKTRDLCVIASDRATVGGHRKRYAFINRLIGHFKDRLEVHGSIAGTWCSDKYATLRPYRYSIAIESMPAPDYFTEKIADCFLTETMPVYYGCPNITDYFSPDSLVSIDIEDYKGSIQAIEKALEEDAYGKHRDRVLEAKHRVLDELQVFPHLVRLLENHKTKHAGNGRSKRELVPAKKQIEIFGGSELERMVPA